MSSIQEQALIRELHALLNESGEIGSEDDGHVAAVRGCVERLNELGNFDFGES